MNNNDIGVIILSGGDSVRMEYPKAFLVLNHKPLVASLSDIYIKLGIKKPIVVLSKNLFDIEWTGYINTISNDNIIVKNSYPELGRTYSIQLGLNELKNKTVCFIQNIDNPDICVELLQSMLKKMTRNSYVVASSNGIGGHPILISTEVLNHLKQLKGSNWLLKEELKKFDRNQVEATTNNVLLNLNTKMDWEKFIEIKKQCST